MSQALRQIAREIFSEAMSRTTVEAAVSRTLRVETNQLFAGDRSYDLGDFRELLIISIGKAGATLFDAVRALLPPSTSVRAIISAPSPPSQLSPGDLYFAGGHPLPNQASLDAAAAAIALLSHATPDTLVLFLISGGASAMFESPLSTDVSLADLHELNRLMIGSGAPIAAINCVRKHLSAVKGGRLAALAPAATKLTLLISDVPPGALDALGSGPTLPDPTTVKQCEEILGQFPVGTALLPLSLARLAASGLPETPKPGHPTFAKAHHFVILDNARLIEAAAEAARRHGFTVHIDNSCDDWDYEAAAAHLINRARTLARRHPRLCLLSGGEVTVRLPRNPGLGGRNQQWALRCAEILHTTTTPLTILSAGSDGIDGASPAAGCVADETTWSRSLAAGLGPAHHLQEFNAFPLFDQLDDAILTGPTGNNLRDLRIILLDPAEPPPSQASTGLSS